VRVRHAVTRPETLEQLEGYLADACRLTRSGAGLARPHELVLVGNKIDAHETAPRAVSAEAASAVVERHGLADYREVSARSGANVRLAFSRALVHGAVRARRHQREQDKQQQQQQQQHGKQQAKRGRGGAGGMAGGGLRLDGHRRGSNHNGQELRCACG
jgi:hypothetical protein